MCIVCDVKEVIAEIEASNDATRVAMDFLADSYIDLMDHSIVDAKEGMAGELYASLLEGAEVLAVERKRNAELMAKLNGMDGVEAIYSDEDDHDGHRPTVH